MSALWHRRLRRAVRHPDPGKALADYGEAVRRAEAAGLPPPAAALNGIGDAYLDLGHEELAGDHHLRAAEGYAADALYDSAIACCRKVLRRSGEHARAGLLLGRYYAAKGLMAEALELLTAAADRALAAGRRRDALPALEELVRIAPGDPRLRQRLGRVLQDEGRREDALAQYRTGLELCLRAGDPAGAEHIRTRIDELEERPADAGPGGGP